jgi:hypothetical protein
MKSYENPGHSGTPAQFRGTAPSKREHTISRALAQVALIADCAERGDVVMAAEARRALNELCLEWNDGLSYPPEVRQMLLARNLGTNP